MKNLSLQSARAIAAIIVLFHHLFFHPYLYWHSESIFNQTSLSEVGDFAVYFFFALSGYVLTMSISVKKKTALQFLKDRIIRIYPEYIFWTLLTFFIYMTIGSKYLELNHIPTGLMEWFNTLTLIPPIKNENNFGMLIGSAWSLVYEMYFYIIFSILLLFSKKTWKISVSMIIIFYISYYIGNSNFEIDRHGWVYWPYIITDFHNLSFAVGSALYFSKDIKFKRITTYLILIATLLFIITFSKKIYNAEFNMVAFSCVILYLTKSMNLEKNKYTSCLSFIGDASFTIYITHISFNKFAWEFTQRNTYLLFSLNIAILFLGCISYQLIGKNLTRLVKSLSK
ncbi:acyltransferase [Tatumella sp. TA1]|nr:acyltransferase [Tatumella sp. TA1]